MRVMAEVLMAVALGGRDQNSGGGGGDGAGRGDGRRRCWGAMAGRAMAGMGVTGGGDGWRRRACARGPSPTH